MEVVVNNDLNTLFLDYINNNYKSIAIKNDVVIKDSKRYYSLSINLEKIKEQEYEYINMDLNMRELINFIIDDFMKKNIICKDSNYTTTGDYMTLLTSDNKALNIYSPNMNNEYPNIKEKFSKINIISNNFYELVDQDKLNIIEIYCNESEECDMKTYLYREFLKKLTLVINTNNIESLKEIKEFINYFMNKNIEFITKPIEIIKIEDYSYRKIYNFDNNKKVHIKGKKINEYLERKNVEWKN